MVSEAPLKKHLHGAFSIAAGREQEGTIGDPGNSGAFPTNARQLKIRKQKFFVVR